MVRHVPTPGIDFHPATFRYPDDFDARWHRANPELASAANAVSLLMPHAEPWVVRSVRAVAPELEPTMRREALAYARQEGQHHAQHRKFNDLLLAQVPALRFNERLMAGTYRLLEERTSPVFGVAVAAGFETAAYIAARWVEARRVPLLAAADPVARDLFLWHLAEEVEHKSVAHDVAVALGISRWRLVLAALVAVILLACFAFVNVAVLQIANGRILNPLSHLRLLGWSITFVFDLLPALTVSLLPGHHPTDLVDPLFYRLWLAEHRSPTD